MQIHFDLEHGVPCAKRAYYGHTLCTFVRVSMQLRYHTTDMKAINLGFSHGSADAQNRFQQKRAKKKHVFTRCPSE